VNEVDIIGMSDSSYLRVNLEPRSPRCSSLSLSSGVYVKDVDGQQKDQENDSAKQLKGDAECEEQKSFALYSSAPR
jgi:hypothetical protein